MTQSRCSHLPFVQVRKGKYLNIFISKRSAGLPVFLEYRQACPSLRAFAFAASSA